VTTAHFVSLRPKVEEAAFGLQHGQGIGLCIWVRPIFSRMVSPDHPEVLEEGTVFALVACWPAKDSWLAPRTVEEMGVTSSECEVITRLPAEEPLVAGQRYFTAGGTVNGLLDSQAHLNTVAGPGRNSSPPAFVGQSHAVFRSEQL
jgi:hypothetical protein